MSSLRKGQALVLVLLSLSVVLTLILFIMSRSVTDIVVSTRDVDSARAFSAAEAGVERALVIGSGATNVTIGDAKYSSTVSDYAESSPSFGYPIALKAGESATLWFVNHDASGNVLCDSGHPCYHGSGIKVCWGQPGTSNSALTTPAIEFSLYYENSPGTLSSVRLGRGLYDIQSGRLGLNFFTLADGQNCTLPSGEQYAFFKTIDFNSAFGVGAGIYGVDKGLQYARVRLLYNDAELHKVGFDATGYGTLPSQGKKIDSVGVSGDANRKVEVFQSWPEPGSIFEYAMFSEAGIVK